MIAERLKSESIKRFLPRFETERLTEAHRELHRTRGRPKKSINMITIKAEDKFTQLQQDLKKQTESNALLKKALEFIAAGNTTLPGEARRMRDRAIIALRRTAPVEPK